MPCPPHCDWAARMQKQTQQGNRHNKTWSQSPGPSVTVVPDNMSEARHRTRTQCQVHPTPLCGRSLCEAEALKL